MKNIDFTYFGDYTDPETKKNITVKISEVGFGKVGGSKIEILRGRLEDENGKLLEEVAIKKAYFFSRHLERIHEFSIMEKLKHPNIVKLYKNLEKKLSDVQTRMAIVMEICECDLEDHVKKQDLTEYDIRRLFIQMVKGLSYLHSEKILHRDIKPSNFLLKKGVIKLADYGISKEIPQEDITKNTANVGTPEYTAPDVLVEIVNESGHYSFDADIFSLGVTLYFMFAKKSPWDFESKKVSYYPESIKAHYKERLAMSEKIFDEIPIKMSKEAKDLILRMLCYDKKERIKMPEIEKHPFVDLKFRRFTEIFKNKVQEISVLQKNMQTIYNFPQFCPDVTLYSQVLLLLCDEIHNAIGKLYWMVENEKKTDWFDFLEWEDFYQSFEAKELKNKLEEMTENAKKNLQLLGQKIPKKALVDFSLGKSQMRAKLEKILEVYKKRNEEIANNEEMVLVIKYLGNLIKENKFTSMEN